MVADPLSFFEAEASHVEAGVRTEAMHKVCVVAAVLGPAAVRESLIPFLVTRVTDLDQVTLALSKKVGDLASQVGGPEHVTSLLPLVELLCGIEETTVRVAITGSIAKILTLLTLGEGGSGSYTTQAMAYFELFLRLMSGGDGDGGGDGGANSGGEVFCSRVAAAMIIPELYLVLPTEIKSQLLEIYTTKVMTDEAIVKRAAANSFIKTVQYCGDARIKQVEFLALFRVILSDETPSVKIIAIEQLTKFAQMIKDTAQQGGAGAGTVAEAVLSNDILPMIKAATEDASWVVRKIIAVGYGSLARCFLKDEVVSTVFPGIMQLVQDQEPDVRSLALKEVLAFLDVIGHAQFLETFVPIAVLLADDPNPDARKILTLLLIDCASKVSKDAVAQHLSDLILRLTVDEDPLVKLRVLQKLDVIAQDTPALCQRLTDPLKTMLGDSNWRVRKQAAQASPAVMKHMGKEYLQTNMLAGLLELLRDGVDQVRTAAAASLPKIAALGGSEWAYESIFPAIRAMQNSVFSVRLSMLTALQGLIEADLPGSFQTEALALLVATTNDKVPNVRLRAAQVLGAVCLAIGPEAARMSIRPVLATLQLDKDRDVQFFATEGLKLCA